MQSQQPSNKTTITIGYHDSITIAIADKHYSFSGPAENFWSDLRTLNVLEPLVYTPNPKPLDTQPPTKLEASDDEDNITVYSDTSLLDETKYVNNLNMNNVDKMRRTIRRNNIIKTHQATRREIIKRHPLLKKHLHFLKAPGIGWINQNTKPTMPIFENPEAFSRFLERNNIIKPPSWVNLQIEDQLTPEKKNPFITDQENFALGKRSAAFESPIMNSVKSSVLENEIDALRYENMFLQHEYETQLKSQDFEIRMLREELTEKDNYINSAQASFNRSYEEELKEADFTIKCLREDVAKEKAANLEKTDTIARTQRRLNDEIRVNQDLREQHEHERLRDAAILNQERNAILMQANNDNLRLLEHLDEAEEEIIELQQEVHQLEENLQQRNLELQEFNADLQNPDNAYRLASRMLPQSLRTPIRTGDAFIKSTFELNNLTDQTTQFAHRLAGLIWTPEPEHQPYIRNCLLEYMRQAASGTCFYFQPNYSPDMLTKFNPVTGEKERYESLDDIQVGTNGFDPIETTIKDKLWFSDLVMRRVFNRATPLNQNNDYDFLGNFENYQNRIIKCLRISDVDPIKAIAERHGPGLAHSLSNHDEFNEDLTFVTGLPDAEAKLQRHAITASLAHLAWPWTSYRECMGIILGGSDQGREILEEFEIRPDNVNNQSLSWGLINPLAKEELQRLHQIFNLPITPTRLQLHRDQNRLCDNLKLTICYEKRDLGWRVHTWRGAYRELNHLMSTLGDENFGIHNPLASIVILN